MTVYDHPTVLYPNTQQTVHDEGEAIALTAAQIKDYKNTDFSPYLTWYSMLIPHTLIPKGYALFHSALALTEDADHREHLETSALQVRYLDSYYRRASLDLMRENLERVLRTVLTADDMETAEQDILIGEIIAYVLSAKEQDYADHNRRMYEDMIAHHCYDIREGFPLNAYSPEQLHFERTPLAWL